MVIGIIPNTSKQNILKVVCDVAKKIKENDLDFYISSSFLMFKETFNDILKDAKFLNDSEIFDVCNLVVSIGGDGTMLNTAFHTLNKNIPILGVNFGKLGFLAEYDFNNLDGFIKDIKNENYSIEERVALEGYCANDKENIMYAINDFVVEKGPWPKMIELTIFVDNVYVTTFLADGLIIASPTGSTGYSLSVGGPIVSPLAEVITISPVSAHSLTMRPLVISDKQEIKIIAKSMHTSVQINSDGQRVINVAPPAELYIKKSTKSVKLIHTRSTNYFEILRNKLFWGLDIRSNN
ncbi:MAG: NAD(+)/NADH kinase [bacterium]